MATWSGTVMGCDRRSILLTSKSEPGAGLAPAALADRAGPWDQDVLVALSNLTFLEGATMGIARFKNGVFRLVVSVRHNADAARLNEWRASFQHASQMLFDATLGQHRFGEILVANRSMGSAEADCWLMEADGPSGSSHGFAQLGEHSTLMADERFRPFIILHEFSHYAYDTFDEYAGPAGPGAECIGGSTATACIMESGFSAGDRFGSSGTGGPLVEGRIRHFCVASNHDPDGDTRQEARRGHSCWESMSVRFPDLVVPSTPPATGSPGHVPNISWVILAPEQRFVLAVDRSNSMAGPKLREAQSGCHWWIDNAVVGDVLGSVSFAASASVDHSLLTLASDADRQSHRAAVDAWVAGGNTAIGGALRAALDEIVGLGQRAATQVAVLLTDGLQNRGEAVEDVLPDLATAGVRVYVIGVGPTIDEALLNAIATITGGRFVRIDPSLSETDESFAIRTALEELSFEVRDNGGLVTSSDHSSEPGTTLRKTVVIEEGCAKATFLVSRRGLKDKLALSLVDPSGTSFSTDNPSPGVRVIGGARPYGAIQVPTPRAGPWKIEVRASAENSRSVPFHLLVGSENSRIGTAFHAGMPTYRPGEEVRLTLRVFAPVPVTGVKIKAELRGPRNSGTPIAFRDDGRNGDEVPQDGAYTAVFMAPRVPGTHRVRALVEGTRNATSYAEPDDLGDGRGTRKQEVVPPFTRTLEASFVVGKK